MTDEQLYEAGDVAALVARHRPSLVQYAANRTGDEQLARRIVDDALRGIGKFQGGDRLFRPWLYAIADKLCQPHDSPATLAKGQSSDAAFAVLDYLEANAPSRAKELFGQVCDRAESWPHPWPQAELMAVAQELACGE